MTTKKKTKTTKRPAARTATTKRPAARTAKRVKRAKGKDFSFKGNGGAAARKKAGIHLLIVRVPVATVKRIDRGLKSQARQPWLAATIQKAAKHARPMPVQK